MKHSLLIMTIILLGLLVQSQDLIIQYDYITKKSEYLKINKNGDTTFVKSPIVKQDQDVELKVLNFNEHALYVETEVTNETLVESTNPFGLLNMLSPIFNVASKGVLNNMFNESGVDADAIEDEFGFATDDNKVNDIQLKKVQNDFMNLNQRIFDLAQLEESIKTLEFGLNQLYILSRNTNLLPNEIKEQARQIVSETLQNGDDPQLTSFYRKREDILKASREQIAAVKISGDNIQRYENNKSQENFGFSNAENALLFQQMSSETENLISAAEEFESAYSRTEIEQMLQLMQQLYFSLQNSSFEYKTNAMAAGDRTHINLSFYDIPPVKTISNNQADSPDDENSEQQENYDVDFGYALPSLAVQSTPKRTKTFNVKVSGGLKISPSVGIAFPSYLNAAKEYYALLSDSIIVETGGDNYIPNIAAFVNFYPYSGRAVNFGGSFGIGIPIKGEKITPNFLLGGSLILGDKYRIALSAGMATGPVNALERGLEVGQKLGDIRDLSTETKYAIGYYSSISFTIGIGN